MRGRAPSLREDPSLMRLKAGRHHNRPDPRNVLISLYNCRVSVSCFQQGSSGRLASAGTNLKAAK
jgi:hypothetical protein